MDTTNCTGQSIREQLFSPLGCLSAWPGICPVVESQNPRANIELFKLPEGLTADWVRTIPSSVDKALFHPIISSWQYPHLAPKCAAYAKAGPPMMFRDANARTPLIFSWMLIAFPTFLTLEPRGRVGIYLCLFLALSALYRTVGVLSNWRYTALECQMSFIPE